MAEGEIVKLGRPSKLTTMERTRVFAALEDYIARTADPTLVGFCAWDPVAVELRVNKDNLTDWKEFSDLRKAAIAKQEAYLLMGATNNKLNATMAIFRLKQPQHGYTDKQERDVTHRVVTPIMKLEEPDAILRDNGDVEDQEAEQED